MRVYICGYSNYYCSGVDTTSLRLVLDNGHEWTMLDFVDSFFFLGISQVGNCDYLFVYQYPYMVKENEA